MNALPHEEPEGEERRIAPRTRTLKRAQVLFNNRFSTYDCIVRNLSSTGALLTIDSAVNLPKVFEMRIGEEKTERPAKLVYRRGMLAGIRFLDVASEDEEQETHFGSVLSRPMASTHLESGAGANRDVAASGHVQRIVPAALPSAIVRNFRWS